jgi:hypothetical protein
MPRGAVGRGIVTKRVTASYIVEEKVDQVLADATLAAITVTLVPRASHVERIVEVQNVGDGSFAVTVASTGGATIDGTTSLAAAGSAATYELDDLGNWHVFGDSSGGAAGSIDGGGTPGNVPLFTGASTLGDSLLSQTSGVVSVGSDFGVQASSGEILTYSGGSPTDGQLLIGDTGSTMKLGSLASADNSVTITPSAGGIDLSAASGGPINDEIPIGAVDGLNTDFLFVGVPFAVFRNGVKYAPTEYSVAGTTATITVPPASGVITGLTQ